MNDNTNLDKIKDRIAKLLRMAEDASSPNEAAIAANRARKLMDQYQLDMLDIGNGFDEEFAHEGATRYFAAFPQYLSVFGAAVGKFNDCQAVFGGGWVTFKKKASDAKQWGKRVEFKGYKSDVQLAIDMYNKLEEAVNRLCKDWMKEQGMTSYSVRIGGQFKMGAVLEIAARLSAMTVERDRLTSTSTGTSLVLSKSKAVDSHFGDVTYRKATIKALKEADDLKARMAGEKAGRMIEIVRSVEGD